MSKPFRGIFHRVVDEQTKQAISYAVFERFREAAPAVVMMSPPFSRDGLGQVSFRPRGLAIFGYLSLEDLSKVVGRGDTRIFLRPAQPGVMPELSRQEAQELLVALDTHLEAGGFVRPAKGKKSAGAKLKEATSQERLDRRRRREEAEVRHRALVEGVVEGFNAAPGSRFTPDE